MKSDPGQVGFFGIEAIVQKKNPLMHLVKKAGWLQQGSAGFHEIFLFVYLCSMWAVANLLFKRASGVFAKSCTYALRMHPPGFAFYITLGFNVERP